MVGLALADARHRAFARGNYFHGASSMTRIIMQDLTGLSKEFILTPKDLPKNTPQHVEAILNDQLSSLSEQEKRSILIQAIKETGKYSKDEDNYDNK
jgi:hypothetical protein